MLAGLLLALSALGQQATIQLPKPQMTGGMPLMEALAKRQTTRAFADKPLPLQTLSNLLWAAFGVNRPQDVKAGLGRTAPSAMNKQEVELYVVLADGVYVYEADQNRLRPVVAGDVRGKIGTGAAAHAAVTIVYVADAKLDYAQVDTGFHRAERVSVCGFRGTECVVLCVAWAGCGGDVEARGRAKAALRTIGRLSGEVVRLKEKGRGSRASRRLVVAG